MEVEVNKKDEKINTKKSASFFKVMSSYKYIYLLLLPGLIFFAIFSYGPMYGIQLAFKDYVINKGIMGSPWVGIEKFRILWGRPEFWTAFRNTLTISFLKICVGFPVPIILAILLNEIKQDKLKKPLQTIFTFPHFLSWVVVSGILMNLLGSQGAVNGILTSLGEEPVAFLTNPTIFRIIIIVSDIWKGAGWSSIIYLAAIAGIDPALYEVATLDGANRWQKTLYITWPGISDTVVVLLILAVGGVMNGSFDQIFNLYNPAVFSTADTIDTYVYRITFELAPDYGLSTAVGLFKGVINCILLVSANQITKRVSGSSIF